MRKIIANQLRKPTGFLGKIISKLMQKGNSSIYDKIILELEIKNVNKILEIGYGHGIGAERILTKYDCFVSGIDFSELMFKQATKRNKKFIDSKKAEFYHGDFLRTPVLSNEYDRIFCLNVVYFWDALNGPFSKIYKGLKEGGLFCMYMTHRDDLNKMKFTKQVIFNKYSIEQIVAELKSAGFSVIDYELESDYRFERGYFIKCIK
jgi:ubiquinone/menaquinone biosynthesis C-methylase UbiE